MKGLFIPVLVVSLALASGAGLSRHKRLTSSCVMRPDNDEDQVVDDGEPVTLECTFDDEAQSCIWTHTEPIREGESNDPDVTCSAGKEQTGQNCQDDTRIQYTFGGNKCGIQISDTKPEDTGKWKMSGVLYDSAGGGKITNDELELFTYNRSTLYMLDEEENDITNGDLDSIYAYNDRQKKWEKDYSNWESVEVTCRAFGGRPEPTFTWYIENNQNDDLDNQDDRIFDVSESSLSCEDRYNYICNMESTLKFTIDDMLMEKLEQWGVDVNPKDNLVRFEVNCQIEQGTNTFQDKVSVEMNIQKRHDNGHLSSDTIGIIVGCILAGILLIIAIALLVYAKNTAQWCFADDEYNYNEPGNKAKQPRSHSGGHHQQQRQHRHR